jgi:autotransporter adhesin
MFAVLRQACRVLGVSRKHKGLGLLGLFGIAASGLTSAPALASPIPALPVVSACTGASLPPSRLTGVVTPLVDGIFTNLDALGLGGLLGTIGAPAVINSALSGAPIGLDVLTTSGTVLAPGSGCAQQADGFTIATPKGITIGGNSIDGLGATGLNANAGEIGSIALGNSAATNAAATNSIALGTGAMVTGTSPNAIAIGNGAVATTAGGVALGGGSVDKAPTPTAGATLNGTAYVFAGTTPASVVSVGAAGAERQLANVAAGQISATSTDAVNGSELFATNTALNAIGATANNSVQYDNPGHTSVTLGGVGAAAPVALGNVAAGALAPGSTAAVNGGQINTLGSSEATNLGGGSTFNPTTGTVTAPSYSVANIGPGGVVGAPNTDTTVGGAIGGLSTDVTNLVGGLNAGTIGPVQRTATPNQLALIAPGGSGAAPGTPQNLTNVANGAVTATSTDGVNGSQLFASNATVSTFLGGGANVTNGTAPTYVVGGVDYNNVGSALAAITGGSTSAGVKYFHANSTGPDSNPIGTDSVAIGVNAVANNANDVALGSGATTAAAIATPNTVINGVTYAFAGATPTSTVSIGAVGGERTLTNLAAGQISATSTDAVNGSELFATNTALNAIGATANNSVQYDNPGHTSVTLGGVGAAAPVALGNVAAGALAPGSTAAVNGGQINTLGSSEATNLGGGSTFNPTTGTVTAPSYSVANIGPGGVVGAPNTDTTVGGAIGGLSTDVTNLAGNIANGTTGLVQQTGGSPGAGQITVGAGTQGTSVTFANSTGATRTLTAVSPGALNATSTDAVNGSQAFAAGTTTATNLGGGSTFDSTTGAVTAPSYTVQGATYNNVGSALAATDGAITTTNANVTNLTTGKVGPFVSDNSVTAVQPVSSGANALAGGFGASATGAASSVVGNGATDNGVANSTVVGQGASVAAGAAGSNVALGQGSVVTTGAQTGYAAYGLAAPQTSVGDVAVGTAAGARQISGVAAGSAQTDAVNVAQLTSALLGVQYGVANPVQYDDSTHKSVTLGNAGTPVSVSNVAAATLSPTSSQAVNGSQLYATNTVVNNITTGGAGAFQVYQSGAVVAPIASGVQSTAGGDGAVASGAGSTAIGYHSSSSGANSVALGAGSTDGGQANVVSLGAPGAERRLTNVAPGVNGTDGVNLNQLNLLAGEFDNSIQAVIRQEQAGDAVALAASGLRYDDRPGTSSIAGGASYYAGHEGVAFGLGHTSQDGNWRYNIAASFVTPEDHADVGVIAGVSYTFGH